MSCLFKLAPHWWITWLVIYCYDLLMKTYTQLFITQTWYGFFPILYNSVCTFSVHIPYSGKLSRKKGFVAIHKICFAKICGHGIYWQQQMSNPQKFSLKNCIVHPFTKLSFPPQKFLYLFPLSMMLLRPSKLRDCPLTPSPVTCTWGLSRSPHVYTWLDTEGASRGSETGSKCGMGFLTGVMKQWEMTYRHCWIPSFFRSYPQLGRRTVWFSWLITDQARAVSYTDWCSLIPRLKRSRMQMLKLCSRNIFPFRSRETWEWG